MRQKFIDFINVFIDLQKALVMLLLITIGVVFRLLNLMNGQELVELLKDTVIAFFAVQATQHIVTSVDAYYKEKNGMTEVTVDPEDPSTPAPPPGVKL